MKKSLFIYTFLATIMATMIGCSGASDSVESKGDEGNNQLEFVMSHAYPNSDFRAQSFAYFAEEVEKRTDGEVKIVIHPSQSLVTLQDSYEAITAGTVDIQALPTSFVTNRIKDLAILDVTGSYPADKFFEVEEAIYPIVSDILEEHNIQYLFPSYESGTAITLREGADVIKTPDLKGYKIRDYGKYVAEGLKEWNAMPVNIPLSDLNLAVQNRTVDGVYTGWPLVKSFSIYEQTPIITYTGLSTLWLPIGMNMDAYNQLTDEQKQIFEEVKWEAMKRMEDLAEKEFNQLVKDTEDAGGTFYILNSDEQQLFLDALEPLFQRVEEEVGPNGNRLIEALNEIQ